MPGDIRDPQPDETSALLGGGNNTVASYVDGIAERITDANNVDETPIPEELPSVQLIIVLLSVWVTNKIYLIIEYSVPF